EDVGLERPGSADLVAAAELAQGRRLLPLDLVCGRVVPGHPGYVWLREHVATEDELAGLAAATLPWDVIGGNYYPWSSRRLVRRRDGQVRSVADSPAAALAEILRLVRGRYNLPLTVTETSAPGSHGERARPPWCHPRWRGATAWPAR